MQPEWRNAKTESMRRVRAKLDPKDENQSTMQGVWGGACFAEGTAKEKAQRRRRARLGPGAERRPLRISIMGSQDPEYSRLYGLVGSLGFPLRAMGGR